jgi:hypothetical protein
MSLSDDCVIAFLLVVGVFFPTSIDGEARQLLVGIAFVLLLGALLFLAWRHGTTPGAIVSISLPILIVVSACTLIAYNFRFGWGIFASYVAIATVFALNLRRSRAGRLLSIAFDVVNVVWICFGVAVILGSEWVTGFLTDWYSQFYSELVPGMMRLHKPVFTFGTHSLAGFFTFLFFWVNWEKYKSTRRTRNLVFVVCELILLVAITSFTSFAFLLLALGQVAFWLWRHNRRALLASVACIVLALLLTGSALAEQIRMLWENPEFAGAVLNSDNGGLLARYGAGGALSGTVDYIWRHPVAPIGFTEPTFLLPGDSGPLQYLLRGSIPLLILMYFGLYRFLRYNSTNLRHALTLFFSFLAFETGFAALPYFRTLFLLPFLVVYLRDAVPARSLDRVRTG